jgi:hypothetical protein
VIEWTPTVSAVVDRVVAPPLRVAVPRTALPFLKVTVPVGVAPRAGWTVALKVTICPTIAGLSEEDTVVVVVDGGTTFTVGRGDLTVVAEFGGGVIVSATVVTADGV